jgi:diguanylate cyclase (GGDEF)-like protein
VLRLPYAATAFDDVRETINRVRKAIDDKALTFYEPETHPQKLQPIAREPDQTRPGRSSPEVERFLAGKVYWLGFGAAETPGEAWIADPWDAEYLGVSTKNLAQSAYILQARNLIELDSTLAYARPSNKLLTGWPAVLDVIAPVSEAKKLSLSSLPKKEQLLADVTDVLQRQGELALLVIDLDNFKSVNDTLGHLEGDACLERIVRVTGRVVGGRGTPYRWGGDEFAVSLKDFSTEEAHFTAERIRRGVEDSKPGNDIPVTTSIGVSGSERMKRASAEELLDAADRAMYASKQAGRNRVTSWPIEDANK